MELVHSNRDPLCLSSQRVGFLEGYSVTAQKTVQKCIRSVLEDLLETINLNAEDISIEGT